MNQPALENAFRLLRAGRFGEAAQAYSDILREDPRDFHALHGLGIARYQTGDLEEAARLIGDAIMIDPTAVEALYNRGSLLMKLNRLEDALSCFDKALALKPDYVEALTNRGTALAALNRNSEALADFDKVVALRPAFPAGWNNRGGALLNLKRYAEAMESFDKALSLHRDYAEAWKNRGSIAIARQDFPQALADSERATQLQPRYADAWEQKAIALAHMNRFAEALDSYDKALSLKAGGAETYMRRAGVCLRLRRYADAAANFERVLELDPDQPLALGNFIYSRLCCSDWRELDDDRARLRRALEEDKPAAAPFMVLAISPAADPQQGEAAQRASLCAAQRFLRQSFAALPPPLWRGERYRHETIRLAYLSGDFYDHAVSRQLVGVVEHHDRTRFEITGISFGWNERGELRPRLVEAFDRFLDVKARSDAEIAGLLREMEIDIAVDLGGYTESARCGILTYRAAPLQVSYLGYPGTTGAEWVDYIIADSIVAPDADAGFYSETIARLAHCYLPADRKRRIAPVTPSRMALGLPRDGFVFCCFNNNYKFNPEIFGIWMRLLKAVEDSVLWLLTPDAAAVANLRREAVARGVAENRLVFAPYAPADADHLARLRSADLFLDTLPYNAHATANDALWAGLPVITCEGHTFPGRVAASQIKALGLPELISASLADYEALALSLARDRAALSALKLKLARLRNTAPLFDTEAYTRDLESLYLTMWQRQQEGLKPEPIGPGGRRQPA